MRHGLYIYVFIFSIVVQGYKRALVLSDLWSLNPGDRCKNVYPEFERYWNAELARCKRWIFCIFCYYTPHNEVEGGILEWPWLSIRLSVRKHNFFWSFSPTVLQVLLWNLYLMFVYIRSCACAIFMTILSLVMEISSIELVNFTELWLSREIILLYCMYWAQSYTQCYW